MQILSLYVSPDFVPFVQIVIALAFGMVLGIERVLVGKTAGPRTYGLVSMGACLVVILSSTMWKHYPTNIDPMPVVAAILTSIGFIGAGLIVLHGSKLSGLTTAAGVWVAAIIGITVGLQAYFLASFATFITLLVFTVMWQVEKWIKKIIVIDYSNENE